MDGEPTGEGASSVERTLDRDDAREGAGWARLPPPARAFARYGVVGRLAVGGMAEIYLAQEAIRGGASRHLVLKVLRLGTASLTADDEHYFESMFLREGRVAMQLSHPNICHTYEFGKWGGHYYIAMEWVQGLSVRTLMERACAAGVRVPPEVALHVVTQIAGALHYAHEARDTQRRPLGVVHRDVTPHNLMLSHDGVVKLLDFGVAKAESAEDRSETGALKGKYGYMAPEQCTGAEVDCRADVFALGVCLYEMLAGRRLYQRGGPYETCRAIVEEPAPSLRDVRDDVPEALDAILRRALAKSPDARFASAGDLEEALVNLASSEGLVATAICARRWAQALVGDELRRGPALTVDRGVLQRLAPVAQHLPISSSPPALGTSGAASRGPRRRAQLATSAFARRVTTGIRELRGRRSWLAAGVAALCVAAAWVWWFAGGTDLPSVTPRRVPASQVPSDEPNAPEVRPAQAPATSRKGVD